MTSHDECSSHEFFGRPVAVLTSQFFLSYDVGGEDCFSPVVGGRVPLTCPVDLDSLYMLPGKYCRNEETGPHAEVWDWMSILCDVARSSQLPVLPDSDCQDRFRGVGRTYVLDLNFREAYSRVQLHGGGLVMVVRFRIAVWQKRCLIRS